MTRPVEIISTVARRRHWTPEEKVEILDEAFRTGSSVAATSDRRGVSRALIYLWRRQAREGRIAGVGMAETAKPAFVPVQLAAITDQSASAASTRKARAPRECRPAGRIEVALTNGRVVKVDESIDPAALARLVTALDGGGS
jgi:transposase